MMSEASFASLGPTLLARKGGAKPAMRPQLTPLPTSHAEIAAMAEEQLEDLGWNDMGSDRANDLEGDESGDIGSTGTSGELARAQDGLELLARKTPQAAPHPAIGGYGNDDAEDGDEDEADTGYESGDEDFEEYEDEDEEGETAETGPHRIIDPLGGAEIVPIGLRSDRARAHEFDEDEHVAAPSPVILSQHKRVARRMLEDAATQVNQTRGRTASGNQAAKNARRAAFTLRLDPARHLKLRLAATMQGISAQALVTDALDALLGDMEELDALVERMTRN